MWPLPGHYCSIRSETPVNTPPPEILGPHDHCSNSSRYFGAPFKVQIGMTQGYLLYSTIFNVVVYAFLLHRVAVLIEAEGTAAPDIGVFLQYIQCMVEYLYADN